MITARSVAKSCEAQVHQALFGEGAADATQKAAIKALDILPKMRKETMNKWIIEFEAESLTMKQINTLKEVMAPFNARIHSETNEASLELDHNSDDQMLCAHCDHPIRLYSAERNTYIHTCRCTPIKVKPHRPEPRTSDRSTTKGVSERSATDCDHADWTRGSYSDGIYVDMGYRYCPKCGEKL